MGGDLVVCPVGSQTESRGFKSRLALLVFFLIYCMEFTTRFSVKKKTPKYYCYYYKSNQNAILISLLQNFVIK